MDDANMMKAVKQAQTMKHEMESYDMYFSLCLLFFSFTRS